MITIKVCERTHSLKVTKAFSTKAAIFGSDEYKMLQEARRDYPGYKVVVTKTKEQKNIFAGLDYDYMEKYIEAHDNAKKSIMAEYMMLRGKSEEAKAVQARSASFLEIRSWFLKTYPAIEAFYTKRAALLTKAAAKPEAKAVEATEANATEAIETNAAEEAAA